MDSNNSNSELTIIVEKLEKLLKMIDIFSIIMTFYQFFIKHDYSFGSILGIFTIILTVCIYFLKNISQIRLYLIENFDYLRENQIDRYFTISCIAYCSISAINFALCTLLQYVEDGYISNVLAKINLFLIPLIFSVLIIIFKILDDNFNVKKLYIYQAVGSIPYLLFFIIGFFDMVDSVLSFIAVVLSSIIFYIPFYLVSTVIIVLCSIKWSEN